MIKSLLDKAVNLIKPTELTPEEELEIQIQMAIKDFRQADEHFQALLKTISNDERIELAYRQWDISRHEVQYLIRKYKQMTGHTIYYNQSA